MNNRKYIKKYDNIKSEITTYIDDIKLMTEAGSKEDRIFLKQKEELTIGQIVDDNIKE
eukprot:CAMPEP_0116992090 /NCGR_PEP_ID=MMETSP0467-20121206/66569_1 /TAXON_ID=283647 /ORGANISM="Mesodinium pulex, Strain SPMC105" /LENGTH=57 /DNA_ID=CAMNT_0004689383 /DNA_START=358 /DNA_END=531 /DNA_ORIENTATION=+